MFLPINLLRRNLLIYECSHFVFENIENILQNNSNLIVHPVSFLRHICAFASNICTFQVFKYMIYSVYRTRTGRVSVNILFNFQPTMYYIKYIVSRRASSFLCNMFFIQDLFARLLSRLPTKYWCSFLFSSLYATISFCLDLLLLIMWVVLTIVAKVNGAEEEHAN